jgi:hypothetical protein
MSGHQAMFRAPSGAVRAARVLAAVGAVTAVAGMFLDPDRLWTDWLLVAMCLLGVALGGLFFLALQDVTGARWSAAIRRVPEAMAATMPIVVAVVLIGVVARPSLYPWTRMTLGAEEGAFRQAWLTWPFFVVRALAYAGAWIVCALAILRGTHGREARDRRAPPAVAPAAVFLVLFAVTFSLASFDWVMSREPLWSSTIFAVYNFAGLFLSGLAVLIILVVWLEAAGPLQGIVRDEHLHDLGKLLFAFSTFWMYIWFSQYMLIWYANIPEEAAYFVARTRQAWQPLFLLDVALNWGIPFVVLLRRDTKRNRATLVKVAAVLLAGRWLDVYLMLLPPVLGPQPSAGVLEVGLTAGAVGLLLLALFHALGRAPLVPRGDPFLAQSLHYHQ